jgi:hypothetical protein
MFIVFYEHNYYWYLKNFKHVKVGVLMGCPNAARTENGAWPTVHTAANIALYSFLAC